MTQTNSRNLASKCSRMLMEFSTRINTPRALLTHDILALKMFGQIYSSYLYNATDLYVLFMLVGRFKFVLKQDVD